MKDLARYLQDDDTLVLGAAGLLAALLLAALLRATVPRAQRPPMRAPFVLLGMYGVFSAASLVLRQGTRARGTFEVLALLAVLLAFGRLLTVFLLDWLIGRRLRQEPPRIVRDVVEAVFAMVAVLVTLRSVGVDPTSLLTTSAGLTAIIGLSLQDTLGNLFAGLALQAQQPFSIGEWIQIDKEGTQVGQVVEIAWRATKLRTLEGAELVIPNGMLSRATIVNFSRPTALVRRSVYATVP